MCGTNALKIESYAFASTVSRMDFGVSETTQLCGPHFKDSSFRPSSLLSSAVAIVVVVKTWEVKNKSKGKEVGSILAFWSCCDWFGLY